MIPVPFRITLLAVNRPRDSKQVKQVYSVRLEPSIAKQAAKKAGGLSRAVDQALREWLEKRN